MSELEQLVSNFASKLTALFQAQVSSALDEVTSTKRKALGGGDGVGIVPARSTKRTKGEKRTSAELENLRAKVLRLVQDNPGSRSEELTTILNVSARELALPMKQLIASKDVRTEGERRGTRYFPRR